MGDRTSNGALRLRLRNGTAKGSVIVARARCGVVAEMIYSLIGKMKRKSLTGVELFYFKSKGVVKPVVNTFPEGNITEGKWAKVSCLAKNRSLIGLGVTQRAALSR